MRKWIVPVVLFITVLPFVAISLLPFFSGAENNQQASSNPSGSPTTTTDAKKSQLQDQEKAYEAVLQREPENQTALKGLLQTRLEMVQLRAGDVGEVIEPLKKLVKLNPKQTNYQVLLAQALQQVGDREGAAQTYRTILAAQPGNIDALRGLVVVLMQQQPEAAIELLQNTLQKAPQANQVQPGSIDVQAVQLLLAEVYAIQKRYDEAIALYDQLSQANKNDFRPVVGKALVLQQQGKSTAAKPLFESAASLAPAQYKEQIKQLANRPPATSNSLTPGSSP